MIDPHTFSFTYFETDQIKFAVQLCKALKRSGGAEFDVLKFTQHWSYADRIVADALLEDDDTVSDQAVQLMQLRLQFVQQFPERARKLGATVAENGAVTAPAPGIVSTPVEPGPAPGNGRYRHGLR